MPGPTTPLTNREKAAIFAYAYGILPDLKTAYVVAEQKPEEDALTLIGLKVFVSRWKNSSKVKTYLEYCSRLIADKEHDARERGKDELRREEILGTATAECERTEKEKEKAVIDYSDPNARKHLYNQIIRRSTDDPKTQLDAAKVLEQLQKDDRQAANEQRQVRTYLPLLCHDCPLYQAEKSKQY